MKKKLNLTDQTRHHKGGGRVDDFFLITVSTPIPTRPKHCDSTVEAGMHAYLNLNERPLLDYSILHGSKDHRIAPLCECLIQLFKRGVPGLVCPLLEIDSFAVLDDVPVLTMLQVITKGIFEDAVEIAAKCRHFPQTHVEDAATSLGRSASSA